MPQLAVQGALGNMPLLADGADAQGARTVQGLCRHGGSLGLGLQALGASSDEAPRPCSRQARLGTFAD